MAHLADNAGIQAHSAGNHFPYVIEIVERDGERRYCVTGPGLPDYARTFEEGLLRHRNAEVTAEHLAMIRRQGIALQTRREA